MYVPLDIALLEKPEELLAELNVRLDELQKYNDARNVMLTIPGDDLDSGHAARISVQEALAPLYRTSIPVLQSDTIIEEGSGTHGHLAGLGADDHPQYGALAQNETVTGDWTFNTGLIVNEGGGDNDSRFEGDTDVNLFFLDASTDRIGISLSNPAVLFEIGGTARMNAASHLEFGDASNYIRRDLATVLGLHAGAQIRLTQNTLLPSSKRLYLGVGTTAGTESIYSAAENHLDLTAGVSIDLNALVVCSGNIEMADGNSIGISGNELLTFNAAGNITVSGANIIVPDNFTLGLSGGGHIEFDDQATDEINFIDCNVGINDATPTHRLDVNGTGRFTGVLTADANIVMGEDTWIGITGPAERLVFDGTGGLITVTAAHLRLDLTNQTQYGDDGTYINQGADGHLDVTGDVSVDINAPRTYISGTLGIGTETVPHGGVGVAMLALEGANSNMAAGPHIQVTTSADNYPVFGILSYSHNNISILFDAYYATGWRSASTYNWRIVKEGGVLKFQADQGIAAGGILTWDQCFQVHPAGHIQMDLTNQIQWGDAGTFINQGADGHLDFEADISLDLNANTIVTGNLDVIGISQLGDGGTTNYLSVEADGSQEWLGAATMWDDANLGAIILERGAAAPDIVSLSASTIRVPAFDGNATTEQLSGTLEIPHSWKEESTVTPHVHWMPTTANAGNVRWQFEYEILGPGDTAGAGTTIAVTIAASGTAWEELRTDFPAITMAGKVTGTQISFRLFRNPTDGADTYGDDAAALTFGIHFEMDRPGSRQIATK